MPLWCIRVEGGTRRGDDSFNTIQLLILCLFVELFSSWKLSRTWLWHDFSMATKISPPNYNSLAQQCAVGPGSISVADIKYVTLNILLTLRQAYSSYINTANYYCRKWRCWNPHEMLNHLAAKLLKEFFKTPSHRRLCDDNTEIMRVAAMRKFRDSCKNESIMPVSWSLTWRQLAAYAACVAAVSISDGIRVAKTERNSCVRM